MQQSGLKHKILNNQILLFLITLYLVGVIFGVFLKVYPLNSPSIAEQSNIKRFFNIFFIHYWYILLIWIFGLSLMGFLFTTLSVFFRGLIFGILFSFLIKIKLSLLLAMILIELIVFLPGFMYLCYYSFVLSLSSFANTFSKSRSALLMSLNDYTKVIVFMTIYMILYSIILIIL